MSLPPLHPSSRRHGWSAVLLLGDAAMVFGGLLLGYWLRYRTPLGMVFVEVANARLRDYLPLLLLGTAFLIGAFAHLNLYDDRLLLRRYQAMNVILKGTAFWLAAYLGVSLVLKFDPPISRLFVGYACVTTLALLFAWRSAFYAVAVRLPMLRAGTRQRVALLGWSAEAGELAGEVARLSAHPYEMIGVVRVGDETLPADDRIPVLGAMEGLPEVLREQRIDVLIVARLDLPRAELARLVATCERGYVELKIIPSVFQIFVSGLRLQTVGRVPVLGIEELAINKLFHRVLKRGADVLGALAGLTLASPALLVLALLIKRESPTGPVFFRQTRVGAGHRPFALYKLRSMRPDAASSDHARVSTARGDTRLLRIGAWMRRWNLDELPQFWNVLRGDMSLVGPRPERPYQVDQLADAIPHYLPRHLIKPGMSGWAQVNGLRGDCSLERRIQHDIYYIENWSIWLDVQILLLTFVRWRNPSE